MKRMKTSELDREAEKVVNRWICQYGAKNANKLSLVVRRKFRIQEAVKPQKRREGTLEATGYPILK